MEIDITSFFENADAFEFSASVAERGANAGRETWTNAKEEATSSPLLTTPDQIEALRDYAKGFGAWDEEEISAWSDVECNALFIQMVARNMREGGLDQDPDDADWQEYERRAERGSCSGNIYRHNGNVYYYLGD